MFLYLTILCIMLRPSLGFPPTRGYTPAGSDIKTTGYPLIHYGVGLSGMARPYNI